VAHDFRRIFEIRDARFSNLTLINFERIRGARLRKFVAHEFVKFEIRASRIFDKFRNSWRTIFVVHEFSDEFSLNSRIRS